MRELQFSVRHKNRFVIHKLQLADDDYTLCSSFEKSYDLLDCRYFVYSADGGLMLVGSGSEVRTLLLNTKTLESEGELEFSSDAGVFSQNASFLAIHKTVYRENAETTPSLFIFNRTQLKTPMLSLKQTTDDLWQPIWSADENILCVYQQPSLRFFERCNEHGQTTFKPNPTRLPPLHLKNVKNFDFTRQLTTVAVFQKTPSKASDFPEVAILCRQQEKEKDGKCINTFSKTINVCKQANIDSVDIQWIADGSGLLALIRNSSSSAQSYYGSSSLYYMGATECCIEKNVTELIEGSSSSSSGVVLSVSVNPAWAEFCVVFAQSKVAIYTFVERAVKKRQSLVVQNNISSIRNGSLYSPNGHCLALTGSGNVPGYLEIWHRKMKVGKNAVYRLVSARKLVTPTCFRFSSDGRFVVAATTTPRLRQDNQYQVLNLIGECVFGVKCDAESLYDIVCKNCLYEPLENADVERIMGRAAAQTMSLTEGATEQPTTTTLNHHQSKQQETSKKVKPVVQMNETPKYIPPFLRQGNNSQAVPGLQPPKGGRSERGRGEGQAKRGTKKRGRRGAAGRGAARVTENNNDGGDYADDKQQPTITTQNSTDNQYTGQ